MHVDGAVIAGVAVRPHVREQLLASHDATGALQKIAQHHGLTARERDGSPGLGRGQPVGIEGQLPHSQGLRGVERA